MELVLLPSGLHSLFNMHLVVPSTGVFVSVLRVLDIVNRLTNVINAPEAKTDDFITATENAVSALGHLMYSFPDQVDMLLFHLLYYYYYYYYFLIFFFLKFFFGGGGLALYLLVSYLSFALQPFPFLAIVSFCFSYIVSSPIVYVFNELL